MADNSPVLLVCAAAPMYSPSSTGSVTTVSDVIVRMGLYSSAKEFVGWPITPGFEFSGTVEAIGAKVDNHAVGDRVFGVTRFGGYATHIAVPKHQLFPVPDSMTMEEAAGFPAVFLTAYFALFELAHPRAGETLLVHSAAGGVGSSLVQLGKAAGCRVVGVVGASHKVPHLQALGADVIIDKSQQDLPTTILPLAQGPGAQILDF